MARLGLYIARDSLSFREHNVMLATKKIKLQLTSHLKAISAKTLEINLQIRLINRNSQLCNVFVLKSISVRFKLNFIISARTLPLYHWHYC